MAAGHNAGEASKAYRLRKAKQAGQVLKPIDALWLDDYEANHPIPGTPTNGKSKHFGASRSGRKVSFELQEAAEAVGTGSSDAAMMAAAALQERAAGERLDSLTINALKVYEKCVDGWAKMGTVCRRILREQQKTNATLMHNLQTHYLGRVEAEAQLMKAMHEAEEGDGDPINALMALVAAKQMGVDPALLPGISKVAAAMKQQAPKKPKE